MKGIQITSPFAINAAEPGDSKYGPYSAATIVACEAAALDAIPLPYRYKGLTVGFILTNDDPDNPDLNKDEVYEYWMPSEPLTGFIPKINSDIAPTSNELSSTLHRSNTTKALRLDTVSKELTLDTNRPITRAISGLQGATVNVNEVDEDIDNLGKLNAFIQAVFFPFVEDTISISLGTTSLIREVGDDTNVTIEATVTNNSNEGIGDRDILKNDDSLGGSYSGFVWNDIDENAGLNDAGVDEYKVECNIAESVGGGATKLISATRNVEYIFPIFMGSSDTIPTDGADVLAAEVATEAERIVAKWNGDVEFNNANSTLRDLWATGEPKYVWIAIPDTAGVNLTKYANGILDVFDVPGGIFPSSSINAISIDDDNWGATAPVAYTIYVSEYKTAFGNEFTLTFE